MSRFVFAPTLLLLQFLSLVLSSSCAHRSPAATVVIDPPLEVRQQPVDVSQSPWHQVSPEELYIIAERSENFRNDRLEIWGPAARRNEATYFELTPLELRKIVAAFDEVNFELMLESSPRGKLLQRRAAIEAGDYRKETFQTFESPEDPALKQLVDSIFAVAAPAAESRGRTIQSLKEGLESVAEGSFVPEVLSLSLHVRSRVPGGGGFVIRVNGGEGELSRYEGAVLGPPRTVELSDSTIRELASRLAYYDVEPMPANLFDEGYRELFVEVLDQEKKIQARSFANLTRDRQAELQIRFEHLVSWLTAAKDEWFATSQK